MNRPSERCLKLLHAELMSAGKLFYKTEKIHTISIYVL